MRVQGADVLSHEQLRSMGKRGVLTIHEDDLISSPKTVYLVGSLRNPRIPIIANALRVAGFDAFDDWWSASEDADEWWQAHEKQRGRTYMQALNGWHARNVCAFDEYHLDRSHAGVLVMPAGKSGHIELGYLKGQGKPNYVLFEQEPDRFDVMYRLGKGPYGVHFNVESLIVALKGDLT